MAINGNKLLAAAGDLLETQTQFMDEFERSRLIERAEEREARLRKTVAEANLDGDESNETLAGLALRENTRLLEKLRSEK